MVDKHNDDDEGIFKGVSPAVKWMRILVPSMLIILFAGHIYMDSGIKPNVHPPVQNAPVEKTITAH